MTIAATTNILSRVYEAVHMDGPTETRKLKKQRSQVSIWRHHPRNYYFVRRSLRSSFLRGREITCLYTLYRGFGASVLIRAPQVNQYNKIFWIKKRSHEFLGSQFLRRWLYLYICMVLAAVAHIAISPVVGYPSSHAALANMG